MGQQVMMEHLGQQDHQWQLQDLNYGGSSGTSNTAGLAMGGTPGPSGVTTTEEFTGETTAVNVVDITTS